MISILHASDSKMKKKTSKKLKDASCTKKREKSGNDRKVLPLQKGEKIGNQIGTAS